MSQAGTILIRAGALLPVTSPPLKDGWVLVKDGRIADFGTGPSPEGQGIDRIDLPHHCLMPGLINAHCHLDYTAFRGALSARHGFTSWLRDLNALKHSLSDDDWLRSIRKGFAELLRSGVTTVVNIVSFPHLLPRIGRPPMRTIWCIEASDVRMGQGIERVESLERLLDDPPPAADRGALGISPHAPYTASPQTYVAAAALAQKGSLLLTTHVAESSDETAMFSQRSGPLFDLLETRGRAMADCGGTTPLNHLAEKCGLASGWLLAHVNELGPGDEAILSKVRPAVVTCPRSRQFFRHASFPLDTVRGAGCRVCIGTDSLASNCDLDLFAEMRALLACHPQLRPEEALRMATVEAAAAIGWGGHLGEIAPGTFADLIAIPIDPHAGDKIPSAREIVEHRGPVEWVMVGGELAR